MYSYNEIQYQNQYDAFSVFYLLLSESVMNILGRSGEKVIRKAVQDTAFELGKAQAEYYEKTGNKPNLKTLAEDNDIFLDPRYRFYPIRTSQQELWFEVHTCPFADMAKLKNKPEIGMMFCEEYCHSFFAGYTKKIGQTNLSKNLLTGYDNHCRFSMYYRPANMKEQCERERVFDLETLSEEAAVIDKSKAHNTKLLAMLFIKFYKYIYLNAKEYGQEGRSAIAMGLRRISEVAANDLRKHAKDRAMALDSEFIRKNYPVNIFDDGIYEQVLDEEEFYFLKINFLNRLAGNIQH